MKVNDEEARGATGADPRQAIFELSKRAAGARVVVTMGTDGALMLDGEDLWHGELDALGSYSTGCGDAFLAGMVTSLQTAPEAWLRGVRAGARGRDRECSAPGTGAVRAGDCAGAGAAGARDAGVVRRRSGGPSRVASLPRRV